MIRWFDCLKMSSIESVLYLGKLIYMHYFHTYLVGMYLSATIYQYQFLIKIGLRCNSFSEGGGGGGSGYRHIVPPLTKNSV